MAFPPALGLPGLKSPLLEVVGDDATAGCITIVVDPGEQEGTGWGFCKIHCAPEPNVAQCRKNLDGRKMQGLHISPVCLRWVPMEIAVYKVWEPAEKCSPVPVP